MRVPLGVIIGLAIIVAAVAMALLPAAAFYVSEVWGESPFLKRLVPVTMIILVIIGSPLILLGFARRAVSDLRHRAKNPS